MAALDVTFLRTDDETLQLEGCVEAIEGEEGALRLTFIADAPGLAVLEGCISDDAIDITGTMTVVGPDRATEFNCTFVERTGNDVVFQLVCID